MVSSSLWFLGFHIQRNSLVNLAGADALFFCCSIRISIYELYKDVFDSLMYNLMLCLKYMFYTLGQRLLAAISIKRCPSALFPILYHGPKLCAGLCALTRMLRGASEEPSFLGMADTTEELDYFPVNTTERSANECFIRRNETLKKIHLHYGMRIPSLLIALFGLLGNGTVLWLLSFRSQRTPFSVYILNLAGADALFLCCSFLIFIERLVRYIHIPLILNIIMCLRYISYTVGLSLLAAISTERCLCALFPLWYRCHRPKHTSASVCAGLWALPSLLRIARFIVCVFLCIRHFCPNFIYIQIAWFVLLTCVLCVSSLTLLLRVQCSSQRRQPPRFYLLVLLTVLVFLLCGLPMGIKYLLKRLFKISLSHRLLSLLACVSSSANPIIYFVLGSQRRKRREPLRVVLQRALGEEREVEG
ncbi:mas-related G-protein coupled receptor member X1-like [Antechinus flavipes]|uniref:mas-related G-protein coupled receptor member X1-like n=1 Tax=Antechinus flavipes TaxID=38775 RepID=UPI0022362DBD|nr:mas-related G-protein coupled receptor member X1-like [Antechinus flavipes]